MKKIALIILCVILIAGSAIASSIITGWKLTGEWNPEQWVVTSTSDTTDNSDSDFKFLTSLTLVSTDCNLSWGNYCFPAATDRVFTRTFDFSLESSLGQVDAKYYSNLTVTAERVGELLVADEFLYTGGRGDGSNTVIFGTNYRINFADYNGSRNDDFSQSSLYEDYGNEYISFSFSGNTLTITALPFYGYYCNATAEGYQVGRVRSFNIPGLAYHITVKEPITGISCEFDVTWRKDLPY